MKAKILTYLATHPGATLSAVGRAVGAKPGKGAAPHKAPLNRALIELRDEGKITATDPRFGEPRFTSTSSNPAAKLTKPFVVPGKYAKAVLTQRGNEKIVGQLTSKDGGRYPVDKQGRTYKTFLTLSGAKTWARTMVKRFDAAAEGRKANPGSWRIVHKASGRTVAKGFTSQDAAKTELNKYNTPWEYKIVGSNAKRNPSQVATLVARGNKKVFVIATDSSESNEALLDRANAIRVIKRVNTNPARSIGGRMKPPTAYRIHVNDNGVIDWQHKTEDGDIYKRPYHDIGAIETDLIDKFGGRFATKIVKEIRRKRVASNPTRNSVPDEWDLDEMADEGNRLGSQMARALGLENRKTRKAAALEPKRYSVTWYSPRLGKRTGFIRPIEADTQAAAKAQAKAMITNDPKASNFIAKEARRSSNPKPLTELTPKALQAAYDKESAVGSRLNTELINAGRGTEKHNETMGKSDPLSLRFKAHALRWQAIVSEKERRQTYHGSLKRTKTNGRSTTPPYRLEMDNQRMAWRGPANNKTLERYVMGFAKSLQPGGANEHLAGRMQPPRSARIVRQSTGEVVAEWKAGAFQVYNPDNVTILEGAIRKAIARAKQDGTVGMSAANLKQVLRSQDYAGLKIAGTNAQWVFNDTFNEALRNVQAKGLRGFRIVNPGNLFEEIGRQTRKTPKRDKYKDRVKVERRGDRRSGFWVVTSIPYGQGDRVGANLPLAEFKTKGEAREYASRIRAKNPGTAREMSERFNGRATGNVTELKASNRAPRDLSRAGKLVFLKLVGAKAQLRIPGAVVCIDPKTERLWIAGNRTPLLNKRANPGEALDFGEIDRICYETAKAHIEDGRTTEYIHTFGEDGGRKPRLQVDAEGMPVIVGGDYKIKAEGIVN